MSDSEEKSEAGLLSEVSIAWEMTAAPGCVRVSIAVCKIAIGPRYTFTKAFNTQSLVVPWFSENSGKLIVWLGATNVDVCEQQSSVDIVLLRCDTLSRNVALWEQRRDNGALCPQLAPHSPSHVAGQLCSSLSFHFLHPHSPHLQGKGIWYQEEDLISSKSHTFISVTFSVKWLNKELDKHYFAARGQRPSGQFWVNPYIL